MLETLARTGRRGLPTWPKYCQVPSAYTSIRWKRAGPAWTGDSSNPHRRTSCRISAQFAEETATYFTGSLERRQYGNTN
jgi:hypothetical protein